MNDKDEKKVASREFAKSSAAGGPSIGVGSKEALAQASGNGKPMLTEEAVNNLFSPSGPNGLSKVPGVIAEAKRDVKGFVRNRFTLTSSQDQQLESLSRQQLESISGVLDATEKAGSTLTVRFGPPAGELGQATVARQRCPTIQFIFNIKL